MGDRQKGGGEKEKGRRGREEEWERDGYGEKKGRSEERKEGRKR